WERSVPRLFCPAPAGCRFPALRLPDRKQREDDFPRNASSGKQGAFSRSAAGRRSQTEQPCHTLSRTCLDRRWGEVSGCRAPGRTDSARVRRTPWKGGVHNRFAGRPEPMVWRPSGEFRFMVWTQNRVRSRLSLRRHRPTLEQLDERCLLSTGAGTSLPHAAASHAHAAALRAHIPASHPLHDHAISRSTTVKVTTVHTAQPATTVAVIDTGVDYNNPALGGGFGPSAKVIAGYDFATNTPDPLATDSQHGTAVAGLIGSDDPNNLGVAPGVKIVALRVTGSDDTASLSSIASALQWVINNHSQYNITVVNMSLSDGGNYAHNWFAQDGGAGEQITNLIGQLQTLNIPVVSATGNSFTGQQGEGFTAIVAGVISVTATDTSDHLLPDAQRLGAVTGMGTMTDLAAPGEGMVAPTGDSGYSSVEGTSFATPLVTGAVVLLQQIYQARFGTFPTVNQVTQWLEQGSDPIYDPVTGLTIGRLDIPKAAALIPSATSSPAATTASAPVTVSIPALQTTPGITSTVTATTVSYVPDNMQPSSMATTPSSTPPASTETTPSSTPPASTATTPSST